LCVEGLCTLPGNNAVVLPTPPTGPHLGYCPPEPTGDAADAVGICEEQCAEDSECGDSEKCCSNGCGHVCIASIPYDCRTREMWSEPKRKWCCEHMGRGCVGSHFMSTSFPDNQLCCKALTPNCRACSMGITVEALCGLCQGLAINDPVCRMCKIATPTPLPEEAKKFCCEATTADCRACKHGLSVEAFCAKCIVEGLNDVGCRDCNVPHPDAPAVSSLKHCQGMPVYYISCDSFGQTGLCCDGRYAESLKSMCSRRDSQHCVAQPSAEPTRDDTPICCEATTADCRACKHGLSVEAFCAKCIVEGLNDVGCRDCLSHVPETAQPTAEEPKRMCCQAMIPSCKACKLGITVDEFCALCSVGSNDICCHQCPTP